MASEVQNARGVVLVVAGDRATRAVIRKFCAIHGLVSLEVEDAAAARQAISETRPAGILCWTDVPGADGIEFGAELRELAPQAHVVLVLAAEHGHRSSDARVAVEHVLGVLQLESVFEAIRAIAIRAGPRESLHLLIVDEDLYLASVLKRALEASFSVTIAATARAALGALGTLVPDAILSELRLEMTPAEFRAALDAAAPGLAARVVYMISGVPDADPELEQFLATIPGRWVTKPATIATLRSLIAGVLTHRVR